MQPWIIEECYISSIVGDAILKILKKDMALPGQNSDIMFEMLFPKYLIDFIVFMRGPSKLVISPIFFLHWYLYKRGRQCWTYM